MKIAACLGVKDEVELIGPALSHLAAIGVDHVIASDANSTDGTGEFLAARVGAGLDHYRFDDFDPDPEFETRETQRILDRAREVGADWLIFVDADEFPLPRGGSLKALALEDADVLVLNRYNVPLPAQGPAIGLPPGDAEVLLYAPDTPRAATQARVRQDPAAPWIQVIPAPKVMLRPNAVARIAEGHHDATPLPGREARRRVAHDLVVAHVPFTTEARFARKIANIARLVGEMGDAWGPDSAWHWKRWLAGMEAGGGAAGEVARNRVSDEDLAELRRAGVIKSAAQVLGLGAR